jgi:hypothetical protein
MVIEPGYVATDMVLAGGGGALIAERMIQPADVAEAALLPARLSPAAVPVELVMRVVMMPYKQHQQAA